MNMVRVNAVDSATGEIMAVGIPTSLPGVEIVEA
jgi:hypothetical protein